ncbi:MAG: AAA domain [Phormidium sp. OSCR]|nr:MAG: AAA domain [Phormidium sp. OSCR]
MITSFCIKNFGPIDSLDCSNLGQINLIIGGNGTGKTLLLKALYSTLKSLEMYQRGNEPKSLAELLSEKFYWTFQVGEIGELVKKQAQSPLSLELSLRGESSEDTIQYHFGKNTSKTIQTVSSEVSPRSSNSIFIPPKEVLSIYHLILESRERDRSFGFDDTYLDLVKALQTPPSRGKNDAQFSSSRKHLSDIIGGRITYDTQTKSWQFKQGHKKIAIGVTAEGVKKISILDTLLGNRYLDANSVIFIDEPESALHPGAISRLLEIMVMLSQAGLQFFLASHSYFVIKKLSVLAQKNPKMTIMILSTDGETWEISNLVDGLPENSIINESIRIYEEKLNLVLG